MSKRRSPARETASGHRSDLPSADPAATPSPARVLTIGALVVASIGAVIGLAIWVFADWWICMPDDRVASYVGRQRCIECHQAEVEAWTGSDHDLAMDLATPETVLGDFDNAELTHHRVTSRMFRKGDKFLIHTEGPEGTLRDFEIKYVFGVRPLQQYMVEFDRTEEMSDKEIGRVQVLRVSWDTQRQCWFYLPPPDVDEKLAPDDDLHWTGIAQRWNNMCADCHSTNLVKGFDAKSRTYHTTFSEIDVSCEACHGPASLHVELAEGGGLFWDRKRGYAIETLNEDDSHVQIHACAPCHSRRSVVAPQGKPGDNYYDDYLNELLQAHTYYADGQILDEVYVFGSFIQSKMYHKGIRCTDCHDPHTARTRYQGNHVCTSCHQHPAGKYDMVTHHRHEMGTTGAACVECHMPESTYMEVDPRRDHSIRIPRPDVSVQLGTPNACTRCHLSEGNLDPAKAESLEEYADWMNAARNGDEEVHAALARADKWCAQKFEEWYGVKDDIDEQPAKALLLARKGDRSAEQKLKELAQHRAYPGIFRATAIMEMGRFGSSTTIEASLEGLSDPNPEVRVAAITNLQGSPPELLAKSVAPLLSDPRRAVRAEAGRVMAAVPERLLSGSQRRALESALNEYRKGILTSNDRAAAHMALALLDESRGDLSSAEDRYRLAIAVEPRVSGPRANLASLLERTVQLQQQRLLAMPPGSPHANQIAKEVEPRRAEIKKLRLEELDLYARDVRLLPDSAVLQYRYGLSLYLQNRMDEAEHALRTACELEPNNPDFVLALALFYQKQEKFTDAIALVRRLIQLQPENPTNRRLLAELRQQAASK